MTKRYWHHPESECVFISPEQENLWNGEVEEISKDDYEKLLKIYDPDGEPT